MSASKRSTSRRGAAREPASSTDQRVMVENINHPDSRRSVDAAKYKAMRRAVLQVLPSRPPGLTLDDARVAVLRHLPASLFPGGRHAGWWFKTVQLDLEAKRTIVRQKTSPLRIHKS